MEPWHQNQYIHPSDPPKPPKGKRQTLRNSGRIYSDRYQPGKLRIKGQKPKYLITDHTGSISNRTDAVLELSWNIQPWVGPMMWSRGADLGVWKAMEGGKSETFQFPELKGSKPPGMDTVRGGEGNRGKPA
jgi:signal peptidase complex subunit 3